MTPLRKIRKAYSDTLRLNPDDVPAVDFIYSLVASLYLPNQTDPVWGFLVAPPSSWKTEGVRPLFDLDCIRKIDDFSANALVSGYVDPDNPTADPSFLPTAVGKTILMKEFTCILTHDDKKGGKVMSTLRSAYDGSHQSAFGTTERGVKGRFGILACVTGAIDTFLLDAQKLGERFLKCRIRRKREHRLKATLNALDRSLDKEQWRTGLEEQAEAVLEGVQEWMPVQSQGVRDSVDRDQEFRYWLAKISNVVTLARSLPPTNRGLADPEEGGRFAQELQNLCLSRATLDLRDHLDLTDLKFGARIAFDTLPVEASKVVKALFTGRELSVDDLRRRTNLPRERVDTILRQYGHARIVRPTRTRFYSLDHEFWTWVYDTGIMGQAP